MVSSMSSRSTFSMGSLFYLFGAFPPKPPLRAFCSFSRGPFPPPGPPSLKSPPCAPPWQVPPRLIEEFVGGFLQELHEDFFVQALFIGQFRADQLGVQEFEDRVVEGAHA